jgi:hypothetical protein
VKRPTFDTPPILYGAYALAGLSIIWSGYAITDLMHSGRFGFSVAIAGDIGWITVLWAEYRGITIRIKDKTYGAAPAGWAIALGVAVLLVLHGREGGNTAQAAAGPFVVLVGKIVWVYALAALRDPTALTADQEAEIAAVMRDSEYEARLHAARLDHVARTADAEIARIRAEARITLARDDADAQIRLERIDMARTIERRSPLAITASNPDQPTEQIASSPNTVAPAPATTSANTDRDRPALAEVVREQIAITSDNSEALEGVLKVLPSANRASAAAAIRRARNSLKGGYN